jgi:hypothetical protein
MKMPDQTLTFEEINVLGNIFNTSFGKSSTAAAKGYGITAKVHASLLEIKYQTIVHYNSSDGLATQQKERERESVDVLNQALASAKEQFRESAGRTLKVKELSSNDDIELVSATANNPRKIAYYRRNIIFEIS